MKIRVTLKDPDGFTDAVDEAIREELTEIVNLDEEEREYLLEGRREAVWQKLRRWVEYKEYVTIEFDTEAGTAAVVERES